MLERKEWKDFKKKMRKTVGKKKSLRKCARNFLRYCDADKNKRISVDEWIDCTGVNRKSSLLACQRPLCRSQAFPDRGHWGGAPQGFYGFHGLSQTPRLVQKPWHHIYLSISSVGPLLFINRRRWNYPLTRSANLFPLNISPPTWPRRGACF